jgi:bifunctional non-homologous end joining protein LigD
VAAKYVPQPLIKIRAPFDHPDWLFELKYDGFRTLAFVEAGYTKLVSRRGNTFARWPELGNELAGILRAASAVLDGELCVLRPDGRSDFGALFSNGDVPHLLVFDVLALEGRDMRGLPLVERKKLLRDLIPRDNGSRVRYVDHLEAQGIELFRLACENNLEGGVGKWMHGTYHSDGKTTSWVKIKNPAYTQTEGRFDHLTTADRSGRGTRSSSRSYKLDPALTSQAPRAVFF